MKTKYVLSILLFLSVKSFSQPGSLDVSFANKGKLLASTPAGYPSSVYSVICKKDGSLLAGSGELKSFLLKQFLTDGSIDSSFGKAGEVRTAFNAYSIVYISSIATVEDNKIVAAGVGEGGPGSHNGDILLAKYLETGVADSSFGKNGIVVSDFKLIEIISSMKITKEGKILVAGYGQAGDEGKPIFFLAQYNADGSVDTNFGESGKVVTDVDSFYTSQINSIAIESDGGIIATGKTVYIPDVLQSKLILAKYTSSGKLDNKFGNSGLVLTDVGDNEEYGNAVAVQDDGKIVVAGAANVGFSTQAAMLILRYNADGSVDNSFNEVGNKSIYIGSETSEARTLIIQPNGDFLLGGGVCTTKTCDFELASVTKDGSIDSSFGTNGLVTTDFSGLSDLCNTLALQQDGKIIAAGGSSDNTSSYITIARYNNEVNKKQIIISKIHRWLQHHNGITWDSINGASYYVVQRSSDGVHFTSLARINAGSTSNLTYADPMPISGTNSYRVQTTSVNNAVAYSNVIALTNVDNTVTLSPNPATNRLHIDGVSSNTKITLFDFAGNNRLQAVANASSYNLNVASLATGNYLLKIDMNGEVITKKFVKE